MFCKENMTVQLLIEFLKRLVRENDKKVFLVLDNLRVHHSKLLMDYLTEQSAFIKLFYLPSYSPDLNPDEFLNRDLKSNLNNKPLGRARGKIEEHAKQHMDSLQTDEEKVKRLFHAESVQYAS